MHDEQTRIMAIPTPSKFERREHKRVAVSLRVREVMGLDGGCMRATSLSVGGLYLPEASPRRIGTRLLVEIAFRDNRPPMLLTGEVCRVGDTEGLGIALRFCTKPQSQLRGVIRESRARLASPRL